MRDKLEQKMRRAVNAGLDLAFDAMVESLREVLDEVRNDGSGLSRLYYADPELADLVSELENAQKEDEQSYLRYAGRKIRGLKRNEAFQTKRGGPYHFRYTRPSGYKWYIPESTSEAGVTYCKITAGLAVKKLKAEIAWVKDGKPPNQIAWNIENDHQQSIRVEDEDEDNGGD